MTRNHTQLGRTASAIWKTVSGLVQALVMAGALADAGVAQDRRPTRTEARPTTPDCPLTAAWTAWAAGHGQVVEGLADGRVLVIRSAEEELTKQQRKILEQVVEVFDRTFGPPPTPSCKPGVFFSFDERTHVKAALEELVRLNPYVGNWSQAMQSSPQDFVIEEPLAAGVAPFFADSEEWSADNELAHRLGHLLLLQRFGHQPYWLTTGFGWYVEQETLGSIYCFPYRDGFVSVGSHSGWAAELANQFKPRKKSVVSMRDVASLARGAFDENAAARAWGAVRFLIENEREALPAMLEALEKSWQLDGRESKPNGTWTRRANFELSVEAQQRILEKHLAADPWQRMTTAFAEGLKSASSKRDGKKSSSTKK